MPVGEFGCEGNRALGRDNSRLVELIQLSGLRPGVDIDIEYTGIRPGEKLSEELYLDSEKADATKHPKILVARRTSCDPLAFNMQLEPLRRVVDNHDEATLRVLIASMVPEYQPVAEAPQPPPNVIPLHAARPRV